MHYVQQTWPVLVSGCVVQTKKDSNVHFSFLSKKKKKVNHAVVLKFILTPETEKSNNE